MFCLFHCGIFDRGAMSLSQLLVFAPHFLGDNFVMHFEKFVIRKEYYIQPMIH
jgi:hypothetical protein